jgi:hypothetical protein
LPFLPAVFKRVELRLVGNWGSDAASGQAIEDKRGDADVVQFHDPAVGIAAKFTRWKRAVTNREAQLRGDECRSAVSFFRRKLMVAKRLCGEKMKFDATSWLGLDGQVCKSLTRPAGRLRLEETRDRRRVRFFPAEE